MNDLEELERLLVLKPDGFKIPVIEFRVELNDDGINVTGGVSKTGIEMLKELNISKERVQEIFKPTMHAIDYWSRLLAKEIERGIEDYER